jgi:hypothetical protein
MYYQLMMGEQKVLACFPKYVHRLQIPILQTTVQQRGFLRIEVREKHIRCILGEVNYPL